MIVGKKVNPLVIFAAAAVLGGGALAIGYLELDARLQLLEHGVKTDGVVVGIDVGVKGLRRMEAEFTDTGGRRRVGRDLHSTQWYSANEIGEPVELYYDPSYQGKSPPDIVIDRGPWIWSNPVLLILGGIALIVFGVFIASRGRANGRR